MSNQGSDMKGNDKMDGITHLLLYSQEEFKTNNKEVHRLIARVA